MTPPSRRANEHFISTVLHFNPTAKVKRESRSNNTMSYIDSPEDYLFELEHQNTLHSERVRDLFAKYSKHKSYYRAEQVMHVKSISKDLEDCLGQQKRAFDALVMHERQENDDRCQRLRSALAQSIGKETPNQLNSRIENFANAEHADAERCIRRIQSELNSLKLNNTALVLKFVALAKFLGVEFDEDKDLPSMLKKAGTLDIDETTEVDSSQRNVEAP
ncbi:hypothetical protein BDV96DRAFT_602929 [Lophiotrema nucula]|uniref:Uncharacterized protein n=1 Tax=Lophiotrema nucula TaxID=690887 RepID=A0A6A5YXT8_9PLEO|nr:hypothetical protein BDV96DRAFT_602929 [Lophiotrema nucula]